MMKNKLILLTIVMILGLSHTMIAQNETRQEKETLHNGIELPEVWPPAYGVWEKRKSMPLPYLNKPPAIIPINRGRQLFVDDFLIDSTNLKRVHHQPEYYHDNPVLKADKEWEYNKYGPYAAPFSDGVWYDSNDGKFKMWYLTGGGRDKEAMRKAYDRSQKDQLKYNYLALNNLRTAYAESEDGVHWEKPILNIYGENNIVNPPNRDAATIWFDRRASDPSKRYKMFTVRERPGDGRWQMILKYSDDGIHWSEGVAQSGDLYDRSTVFYNPFISKWVLSIRCNSPIGRARCYLEHSDEETLVSLAHRLRWDVDDTNINFWFGAGSNDPRHPKFPDIKPEIYNHDAIAYESIMLGFFSVWEGPENDAADSLGIQKRNEVLIGYSRDGFHWQRPSHEPFMGVNEEKGAWNWGNVQSVVGVPIIKDDSLYFYVSGRKLSGEKYMWDSNVSTGLATMRRDGFVSMDTPSSGYLTTRNLSFDGKYLFVNADVEGSLQVEVLNEGGDVIQGYSRDESIPVKGDDTKFIVSWEDKKDLADLKNQPIKFRFYINGGAIYSFWVSPWETGESRGYTAGGGPGLNPAGIDLPQQE